MALISEPFRSYDNLYNDSRNFAFVAIMGMGQMLVIITGGITCPRLGMDSSAS